MRVITKNLLKRPDTQPIRRSGFEFKVSLSDLPATWTKPPVLAKGPCLSETATWQNKPVRLVLVNGFERKGLPATWRERIEAVVAAGCNPVPHADATVHARGSSYGD